MEPLGWIWNEYKCFNLYFQNVEFPDSMSPEMRSLLEGLLKRDVEERLGCKGGGSVSMLDYYVQNDLMFA